MQSLPKFKLLTPSNPKIAKGTAFGWYTAVLHLAPANLSGWEVCPNRTAGCTLACLNTAGRGGMAKGKGRLSFTEVSTGTRTNTIQAARIRRTALYFEHRPEFMAMLVADIEKVIRIAAQHGLKPAIRLNGTSDIPWERVKVILGTTVYPNLMTLFPNVMFYDYTKRANRRDLPANYKLTFSLAENNDRDAEHALCNGMNVAVVFHSLPPGPHRTFVVQNTMAKVIDGDQHDLRFLDPTGVIVGLKAKGNARNDTSGFVR